MASLLFLMSNPTDLNFSFTFIFDKQRSLSQYLFKTFMNWSLTPKRLLKLTIWIINLPWLRVLSLYVLIEVTVRETELSGLNTLLNSLFDLKDMDRWLLRDASQKILRRVENNLSNLSLRVTSLQFLHDLAPISAVKFDDMPSGWGWSDQSTFWVDGHGTNFGIVSWDHKINRFVNN